MSPRKFGLNKKSSRKLQSAKANACKRAKQAAKREHAPPPRVVPSSSSASSNPAPQNAISNTRSFGVRAAFTILFFIVYHNLSLSLAPAFVLLAKLLGFVLSHLSINTVPQLLQFAADHYLLDLVSELNDPDGDYVAILMDESTDIDCNPTLIVIVRLIRAGSPIELFFDNIVLEDGGDAKSVATALIDRMKKQGVDMELLKKKLVCLGTDGASVMRGKLNGVGQQLRNAGYDKLVLNHCFAHRLDLVNKEVFNTRAPAEAIEAITVCHDIAKAVHTSSRSRKLFAKLCSGKSKRTIPIVHVTRWLKHYEHTTGACVELRDQLCTFFTKYPNYDKHARLHKYLSDNGKFLHLLATHNAVMIMSKLSEKFQRRDLTIIEACKQIRETESELRILSIDRVCTNTELYARALRMKASDDDVLMQQLQAAATTLGGIAREMLDSVSKRFAHKSRIEMTKPRGKGKPKQIVIEPDRLIQYANYLIDAETASMPLDKLQEMLTHFGMTETASYSNRAELVEKFRRMFAVFPPSTAECERGFSQINLIKTKLRNSLKPETLSNIMLIRTNSDRDLSNAPCEELARNWMACTSERKRKNAQKPRRSREEMLDNEIGDDDDELSGDDELSDDDDDDMLGSFGGGDNEMFGDVDDGDGDLDVLMRDLLL